MDKKVYFLFLEKGCPRCATVFGALDLEKIVRLEYTSGDIEFHVALTFTNNSTEELFSMFGIDGKNTPVLLMPDGKAIDDVDEIISIMKDIGVDVRGER